MTAERTETRRLMRAKREQKEFQAIELKIKRERERPLIFSVGSLWWAKYRLPFVLFCFVSSSRWIDFDLPNCVGKTTLQPIEVQSIVKSCVQKTTHAAIKIRNKNMNGKKWIFFKRWNHCGNCTTCHLNLDLHRTKHRHLILFSLETRAEKTKKNPNQTNQWISVYAKEN